MRMMSQQIQNTNKRDTKKRNRTKQILELKNIITDIKKLRAQQQM